MDFNKKLMDTQGHGNYESLDPNLLPPIYLAYISDLSEISGIAHGNLRGRFMAGDTAVIEAMKYFAERAELAREAILKRQPEKLFEIMNQNFDKRKEIFPISRKNLEMVNLARMVGASAKFPGSGGAIVGMYTDEKMFNNICRLKLKVTSFPGFVSKQPGNQREPQGQFNK